MVVELICKKTKPMGKYECVLWDSKTGRLERYDNVEDIDIETDRYYSLMMEGEKGFYSKSIKGQPTKIEAREYSKIYVSGNFSCEKEGEVLICY